MANPLLTEPLRPEHVKPRLLGHWGTSPGLNLVYTHLNRVIRARELDALCVWGPGHGGLGGGRRVLAGGVVHGDVPRHHPGRGGDGAAVQTVLVPRRRPQPRRPETPGSIHEGGELGYSLSHAYGAALDHPDLVAVCVVGDGEAETGPLAASWHSNKFLDPVHDGAVLPILHLNGYKIANPTVLARIPDDELDALLRGYGHDPLHVIGDDPAAVHQAMARALDTALDRIAAIRRAAREDGATERPRWPMIVLRTPRAGPDPPRSTACPSRTPGAPTRCRCPASATTPTICASWRRGCGRTGRRSCSTRTAAPAPTSWPASPTAPAASAPPRTPTAG